MSMMDCIQRALDAKLISPTRARAAQAMLAARRQAHAHLGPGADMAAAEDVWLQLRTDYQRRKRTTLLQAEASARIITDITNFVDSDGTKNPARALHQMLEWGQSATFESVSSIRDALGDQYRRMIGEFLEQHKRDITGGVRNKARLPDIVRELMGETTGKPASKQMAAAISAALERARLDFNAAGGSIGRLSDFGLPHAWEGRRMLKLGKDAKASRAVWVNDIADKLDWDRITDHGTGQPFAGSTPAARQKFLDDVFDTITESGRNKREPSGVVLGKSTANSRSDARILHFKSADDWMDANAAYGSADVFATIVAHLDGMARDTAQMRVFGPNPRAGLELAVQTASKLGAERPWTPSRLFGVKRYSTPQDEVDGAAAQARRMLDIYNGSANKPESDVLASAFSGTRHFLIASQLGGAMLSAVTDVGFMGMAAKHVGIRPDKVLGRHVKALASTKQRALMARAGIIAESAANVGVAQSRLMGDAYGPAAAERLSEFTMRASGLTAWTDIGRGAFRLEFYGYLAENAGRSWDDIDKPLRELVFEARGITRADWDDIRATTLFRDAAEPDASFLIPGDIRNRTDLSEARARDLSLKLEAAIREQMEFAVPSASLRGRATMHGGAPGSLVGELMRSGIMYKSFMFSLMYNQLGRILYHPVRGDNVLGKVISALTAGKLGSRSGHALMFATITTLAGALSLQMKDIAKGRDPRDMTTGEFWMAAFMQGGGAGIFGDFLYASENRFGGGLASTVAGPGIGFASDTLYLGRDISNALIARDQKSSDRLARSSTKFIDRYSGPTNLWYANLALNRMLWDNLQEFFDSDATAAFRRSEKRRSKIYGTGSFWSPGTPAPQRAPDLSNILGASQP